MLPASSATVSFSIQVLVSIVPDCTALSYAVTVAVHTFVLSSLHVAIRSSPMNNWLASMRNCLPPDMSTSDLVTVMVGGVTSSSSFVHAVNNGTATTRVSMMVVNWRRKGFQVIVVAGVMSCSALPERFERFRMQAVCGATSSRCAYRRAAAMLTCLHIPMQHTIARFSFSVLAPSPAGLSSTAVPGCERR